MVFIYLREKTMNEPLIKRDLISFACFFMWLFNAFVEYMKHNLWYFSIEIALAAFCFILFVINTNKHE